MGPVGILDWYTVLTGIFMLVTFAAHGANTLVLRTEGPVHDRSLRIAKALWNAVLVILAVVTLESWRVRPELLVGMSHKPIAWLGMALVIGGVVAIFKGLHSRRELCAVMGSSAFIAGLMTAGAASVYPIMLRSTVAPEYSLSADTDGASGHGLGVALVWWPIALVFSMGYFLFIYKYYTGKVKPAEDTQNPY
jgi:cytochrome d ubiquinol oxidase subunit II